MTQTTRTALVTGASSGIGEEFACQLAAGGYSVILVARRKERLEQLASELAEKHDVHAEALAADLLTPDGLGAVKRRLAIGDVDYLVNNAGFGTLGEFANLPLERELDELDLNIKALVTLTHCALRPMIERRRGTIINVASLGAFQPCPNMATYVGTKAFVLHFTESVHEEARRHGVTVTCLCPGFVPTEFQQVSGVDLEETRAIGQVPPREVAAAAIKGAAAGRAIVIPGAISGVLSQTSRFMPRFLTRKIAGSFIKEAATKGP